MNALEINEIETQVDNLICAVSPVEESNKRRKQVFSFAEDLVQSGLKNTLLVGCGSSSLKCYLPESDLDLILFTKQLKSKTTTAPSSSANRTEVYYLKGLFNSLCDEVINKDENKSTFADMIIRNVEFINARTKVTHCVINNIQVDITVNHISALKSLLFLEEADREIGCNHLFKRSLLLIKNWCLHESPEFCGVPIIGSRGGMLSSYAISVLVLHLFNKYGYGPPVSHHNNSSSGSNNSNSSSNGSHSVDERKALNNEMDDRQWCGSPETLISDSGSTKSSNSTHSTHSTHSTKSSISKHSIRSSSTAGKPEQHLLRHPLQVLELFLQTYMYFQWDSFVLTLTGPQPIVNGGGSSQSHKNSGERSGPYNKNGSSSSSFKTPPQCGNRFQSIIQRINKLSATYDAKHNNNVNNTPFSLRCCNIQDPMNSGNNLGISVTRSTLHTIECALQMGHAKLFGIFDMYVQNRLFTQQQQQQHQQQQREQKQNKNNRKNGVTPTNNNTKISNNGRRYSNNDMHNWAAAANAAAAVVGHPNGPDFMPYPPSCPPYAETEMYLPPPEFLPPPMPMEPQQHQQPQQHHYYYQPPPPPQNGYQQPRHMRQQPSQQQYRYTQNGHGNKSRSSSASSSTGLAKDLAKVAVSGTSVTSAVTTNAADTCDSASLSSTASTVSDEQGVTLDGNTAVIGDGGGSVAASVSGSVCGDYLVSPQISVESKEGRDDKVQDEQQQQPKAAPHLQQPSPCGSLIHSDTPESRAQPPPAPSPQQHNSHNSGLMLPPPISIHAVPYQQRREFQQRQMQQQQQQQWQQPGLFPPVPNNPQQQHMNNGHRQNSFGERPEKYGRSVSMGSSPAAHRPHRREQQQPQQQQQQPQQQQQQQQQQRQDSLTMMQPQLSPFSPHNGYYVPRESMTSPPSYPPLSVIINGQHMPPPQPFAQQQQQQQWVSNKKPPTPILRGQNMGLTSPQSRPQTAGGVQYGQQYQQQQPQHQQQQQQQQQKQQQRLFYNLRYAPNGQYPPQQMQGLEQYNHQIPPQTHMREPSPAELVFFSPSEMHPPPPYLPQQQQQQQLPPPSMDLNVEEQQQQVLLSQQQQLEQTLNLSPALFLMHYFPNTIKNYLLYALVTPDLTGPRSTPRNRPCAMPIYAFRSDMMDHPLQYSNHLQSHQQLQQQQYSGLTGTGSTSLVAKSISSSHKSCNGSDNRGDSIGRSQQQQQQQQQQQKAPYDPLYSDIESLYQILRDITELTCGGDEGEGEDDEGEGESESGVEEKEEVVVAAVEDDGGHQVELQHVITPPATEVEHVGVRVEDSGALKASETPDASPSPVHDAEQTKQEHPLKGQNLVPIAVAPSSSSSSTPPNNKTSTHTTPENSSVSVGSVSSANNSRRPSDDVRTPSPQRGVPTPVMVLDSTPRTAKKSINVSKNSSFQSPSSSGGRKRNQHNQQQQQQNSSHQGGHNNKNHHQHQQQQPQKLGRVAAAAAAAAERARTQSVDKTTIVSPSSETTSVTVSIKSTDSKAQVELTALLHRLYDSYIRIHPHVYGALCVLSVLGCVVVLYRYSVHYFPGDVTAGGYRLKPLVLNNSSNNGSLLCLDKVCLHYSTLSLVTPSQPKNNNNKTTKGTSPVTIGSGSNSSSSGDVASPYTIVHTVNKGGYAMTHWVRAGESISFGDYSLYGDYPNSLINTTAIIHALTTGNNGNGNNNQQLSRVDDRSNNVFQTHKVEYFWTKDHILISGPNSKLSHMTIKKSKQSDDGHYRGYMTITTTTTTTIQPVVSKAIASKAKESMTSDSAQSNKRVEEVAVSHHYLIAETIIHISRPPKVFNKQSYQNVVRGTNFLLQLKVEGNPPPVYQWFKNGYLEPTLTNQSIYFEDIQVQNSGTYSCEVSNIAGTAMWVEATIAVIP